MSEENEIEVGWDETTLGELIEAVKRTGAEIIVDGDRHTIRILMPE